jgi:hypothetical protein
MLHRVSLQHWQNEQSGQGFFFAVSVFSVMVYYNQMDRWGTACSGKRNGCYGQIAGGAGLSRKHPDYHKWGIIR